MQDNKGINKLAGQLQKRMNETMGQQAQVLDFGEILGDYSLKTNTFPVPIPGTDYQVCRGLTFGEVDAKLTTATEAGGHTHTGGAHSGHTAGTGEHEHLETGAHTHTVVVPEKMRGLLPGDRVLVAWIGNDAVVVDIILPATEVMGGA